VCPTTDDPVDGVAVLTAALFMLDAGLMMLGAQGKPRSPLDAESEGSNESVASDPPVNVVEVYKPLIPAGYISDHLDD
jgi:hypothetical protein